MESVYRLLSSFCDYFDILVFVLLCFLVFFGHV